MFGNIHSFWQNYHDWILSGISTTLLIGFIAIVLGSIIAIITNYVTFYSVKYNKSKVSSLTSKIVNAIVEFYLMFFRFTPAIVLAFFFYFVLMKDLPISNIGYYNKSFYVGAFVVSLIAGAYFSKTLRGGIISVSKDQYKAGRSLGLSHSRVYFNIILPQAFKNIVPQTSNEFINAIKATSVLSVISVQDVVSKIQDGNINSFDAAAGFTILLLIYFGISLSISIILKLLTIVFLDKRKYAKW